LCGRAPMRGMLSIDSTTLELVWGLGTAPRVHATSKTEAALKHRCRALQMELAGPAKRARKEEGVMPGQEDDCLVCCACPRIVRLLPCCHASMCTECALDVLAPESGGRDPGSVARCPTCRAVVDNVIWKGGAADGDEAPMLPVPAVRMQTFDPAHQGEPLTIREFVLAARGEEVGTLCLWLTINGHLQE